MHKSLVRCLSVFLFAVALSAGRAWAQNDALASGVVVERALNTQQAMRFAVALPAGYFAQVDCQQLQGSVALELWRPDGQLAFTSFAATGWRGIKRVIWNAETAGVWTLVVKQESSEGDKPARFALAVRHWRMAAAHDLNLVLAERDMAEGLSIHRGNAVDRYVQSRPKLESARQRYRECGDTYGLIHALKFVAKTWETIEPRRALALYEEALPLARSLNDAISENELVTLLGIQYLVTGDVTSSESTLRQAVTQSQATGYQRMEAAALNALGALYSRQGAFEQAIQHYQRVAEICRQLPDQALLGQTLNNLGMTKRTLGEHSQALHYFEQSYQLRKEANDVRGQAVALMSIGQALRALGNETKALASFQTALALSEQAKYAELEASTSASIAAVYFGRKEFQTGLPFAERALALRQRLGNAVNLATSLLQLGRLQHELGQLPKARENLQAALKLLREASNAPQTSNALAALAGIARDQGDLSEALADIEEALRIVENLREGLFNPETRATFSAEQRKKEELYFDLLLRLQEKDSSESVRYASAGLVASERRRARVLRELLTEARTDIRQGVKAELLAREAALSRQLAEAEDELTRQAGRKSPAAKLDELRQQLAALNAAYQQTQSEIRQQSPRYAALMRPATLGLREIQQQLGADTALLEYALGEFSSTLWVVTAQGAAAYRLPARKDIESAARLCQQRLLVSQQRRSLRAAELAALALRRMILPAELPLAGLKRLAVVADGALQFIPFGVLPQSAEPVAHLVPLLASFEIAHLPSASALVELRLEKRSVAPKQLAVFSDPVFSAQDARVQTAHANQSASNRNSGQIRAITEDHLSRLPYARQEAEAILKFVPAAQSYAAFDFAANRAQLWQSGLQEYRYLHFATHGLFDDAHPALSGIALSLVNERGEPQDGYLRLNDLFRLKLNAEVVTLSACRTALGQEVRGEGLVGVARGFFYAGTPRIVASLWDVNDVATAELMKRFYRGLLVEKLAPAAALRAAQLTMAKEPRWAAPFYWAGFVLLGEWK